MLTPPRGGLSEIQSSVSIKLLVPQLSASAPPKQTQRTEAGGEERECGGERRIRGEVFATIGVRECSDRGNSKMSPQS